jgi:hypothetical protein
VDIALSEPLAPVLHDLGNSGAPVPDVRNEPWSDFPGQVTAMLHDFFGHACRQDCRCRSGEIQLLSPAPGQYGRDMC